MNNYLEFYLKLIKKNSIVVFYELNLEENYNFFNEYKEYFIQNQNVFINISSQNNYKNLAEFFINVKTFDEKHLTKLIPIFSNIMNIDGSINNYITKLIFCGNYLYTDISKISSTIKLFYNINKNIDVIISTNLALKEGYFNQKTYKKFNEEIKQLNLNKIAFYKNKEIKNWLMENENHYTGIFKVGDDPSYISLNC